VVTEGACAVELGPGTNPVVTFVVVSLTLSDTAPTLSFIAELLGGGGTAAGAGA